MAESAPIQAAASQFITTSSELSRRVSDIKPIREKRTELNKSLISYLTSLPEDGPRVVHLEDGSTVGVRRVKRKETVTKEYAHGKLLALLGSREHADAAVNAIWENRPTKEDYTLVVRQGSGAGAAAGSGSAAAPQRKRGRAAESED